MNSIERALGKILGTTNKEIAKSADVDDTSIPGPTRQERALGEYSKTMQEVRKAHQDVAAAREGVIDEEGRLTAEQMRQAHSLKEGFTTDNES